MIRTKRNDKGNPWRGQREIQKSKMWNPPAADKNQKLLPMSPVYSVTHLTGLYPE
jgi:hypothetical protein